MSRRTLKDGQGERIALLVPGKAGDSGATGKDNRLFVDAVLWMARTGAPWCDLPGEMGRWNKHVAALRSLVPRRRMGAPV